MQLTAVARPTCKETFEQLDLCRNDQWRVPVFGCQSVAQCIALGSNRAVVLHQRAGCEAGFKDLPENVGSLVENGQER